MLYPFFLLMLAAVALLFASAGFFAGFRCGEHATRLAAMRANGHPMRERIRVIRKAGLTYTARTQSARDFLQRAFD